MPLYTISYYFILFFYIFNSIILYFNSIYTFSENADDCNTSVMENNKDKKFKLNFNATNAFKYDSSDSDEDLNEVLDTGKQMTDEVDKNTNSLFEYKDTLFLDNKDVRFNGMYMKKIIELLIKVLFML